MRLTVRHLTGSRAGEQQTFDANEVTIGRHPTSMVLFDPEKDRVVSTRHASLSWDQNGWLLRDLGSSNGTFIEGDQVTSRLLKPGDIIQLGKNGPKVQVDFESEVAPTIVVPLNDLRPQQPPREGKTLIMMMPGADAASDAGVVAPAPARVAPAARKKGGIGKALAIVAAVLLVLIVGAAALAFAIRSSNLKKRRAADTAAAKAPAAAIDPAAAARKQAEADRINQQIAQQQQQIAQTEADLQKTQGQSDAATNQEAEDLKRQLAESQALLEQMTRELQAKNDEIDRVQAKQPEVRYVPAAAPRPNVSAATKTSTATRNAPAPSAPAQKLSEPAAATPAVAQATAPLFTGKRLKKKVLITPLPSEIPPANMPSGAARDLANLLTAALVSTGDFVAGPKGQASVSVMVTNYRAQARKGVDVKKTTDNARRIGKIFGQNVPSNPVDVRRVAYDAAMSVRVRLYDPAGRLIAEVEPSAEASDRKTKTALAGVSFNDVAFSDTAAGDVARKVIGDAIDTVRNGLANVDWSTTVQGQSKEKVTLASGRNANVEPGDVFELTDGRKPLGRVRVISVTETASDAEFITSGATPKLTGKTARYIGSENAVSAPPRERTLTVRIKTPAYDGPGDSFRTIKDLRVGQKMKFHYSVGSWARASDGGTMVWIPLSKVQISG